jgi:hypothetical protein
MKWMRIELEQINKLNQISAIASLKRLYPDTVSLMNEGLVWCGPSSPSVAGWLAGLLAGRLADELNGRVSV